jgi:hypothetical protein
MTNEEMAEKLGQAALRGWFNDPDGFRNMRERGNRQAVKSLLKVLDELLPPIHVQPPTESERTDHDQRD